MNLGRGTGPSGVSVTVKSQGHVEIYIDASNAVRHCIYTRCRIYDLDITGPALCSQLFPNASLNRAIQSVSLALLYPSSIYLPTAPPPLRTPEPDQALPANLIPTLQQRCYIYVERAIHLRIRQQLVYSLQCRCERVCR